MGVAFLFGGRQPYATLSSAWCCSNSFYCLAAFLCALPRLQVSCGRSRKWKRQERRRRRRRNKCIPGCLRHDGFLPSPSLAQTVFRETASSSPLWLTAQWLIRFVCANMKWWGPRFADEWDSTSVCVNCSECWDGSTAVAEHLLWKLFAVDGEMLCCMMFFLQTLHNGDPEPKLSVLSSVNKPRTRRKIGNGKLESCVCFFLLFFLVDLGE